MQYLKADFCIFGFVYDEAISIIQCSRQQWCSRDCKLVKITRQDQDFIKNSWLWDL